MKPQRKPLWLWVRAYRRTEAGKTNPEAVARVAAANPNRWRIRGRERRTRSYGRRGLIGLWFGRERVSTFSRKSSQALISKWSSLFFRPLVVVVLQVGPFGNQAKSIFKPLWAFEAQYCYWPTLGIRMAIIPVTNPITKSIGQIYLWLISNKKMIDEIGRTPNHGSEEEDCVKHS